jgi:hypothetical protein
MKKASIVVDTPYRNNNLFSRTDPVFARDDCLYCFYQLREELKKEGVELNTQDITSINEADYVIFNDMPLSTPPKGPGQKFFLLALESIAVLPDNFDVDRYDAFDRVFTWYDRIVDGSKVIKINYSFLFKTDFPLNLANKEKLVCLIANNKRSPHPGELYSERVKAIDWFEKHRPDDFDLFGQGWDAASDGTLKGNVIRKLGLQRFFRFKRYACHKGVANPKLPLLRRYKFNICYENVINIPGYVTEKIFDCFFAGCVPVYLGASNITDFVPKECFVDKRDFPDYGNLYAHLMTMADEEYLGYLHRIREFLTSERSYPFTSESFAKTIVNWMVNVRVTRNE